MKKLKLHTDGGSRGNPGHAAYGYVIYDVTSGLPGEAGAKSGAAIILEKCGNYIGVTTNNQAEYKGLIAGLSWIATQEPDSHVDIYMDSLLIVSQIKGEYKVKHPDMLPLYKQVMELANQLPSYTINYVPRAQNSVADALVNQALDAHTL